jgi:PAS domain-containing protein
VKSLETTQLLPAPSFTDPRVHLLDDLWLLTIFAILLAAGLPWLVSSFSMQIGAALLGLLALTAVHVAFTVLVSPSTVLSAGRRRALALLHAVGVAVIGLTWHYAGGLQNPAFLIVFALPVVGAIFLSRWQPYVAAAVAVFTIAIVALAEAPELRWYASGFEPFGPWLVAKLGASAAAADTPFPGFYAPAGYYLVLLEGFAILMLACAFAAEYLGAIFDRLHAHVDAARIEAEHGHELWSALIEDLPRPAVLVDAATMQIVAESASLAEAGWTRTPALGRKLGEVVQFSYPEIVEELIAGAGGTAPEVTLRAGGELKMARVHVQHVAHRGRRFALVLMEDRTEAFAVRAALDAAEQATLVVDAEDRLLAFNKPAQALFSSARAGAEVEPLLALPELPERWWEPGLTGRRKMHVRILPRLFQVTSTAVALPGEREHIVVIAFLPIARAEAADVMNSTLRSQRS